MKGLLYFIVILQINLVFPQYFDDVGERIRQQVHDSLRGTENLGTIISHNVRQQLPPDSYRYQSNYGLPKHNIRHQSRPSQDLGDDITQMVNNKLQPVYAMAIKNNMKNGVGGTTVVTYDSGKKFIMADEQRYTCNGNIRRGECNGSLHPFQILNREDYCYSSSFAVINGHVCLGTGAINIASYNNRFTCRSSDGSEIIVLTNREYQDLCRQAVPLKASYEYYANPNSPDYIPIPNPNSYITCLNNEPDVCNFEDVPSGSGSYASNQNYNSNQNSNSYSYSGSFD